MPKQILFLVLCIFGFVLTSGHQQQQYGQPQQHQHQHQHQHQQQGNVFDKAQVQDREHIQEHLEGVIQQSDTSKMSKQELQFHYFNIYDTDNNKKLDGTELIKAVIHSHDEVAPPKIHTDDELCVIIDPFLESGDGNKDGFLDYPEFEAAQLAFEAKYQN